jgi:hypothetical protein
LFKYVKAAFSNRWNLLAMFTGVALSVISGQPDVGLPLVLAGEMAYLTMLASHNKFQRHVDAQEAKAKRVVYSQSTDKAARRMLKTLPRSSYDRFRKLQSRCLDLRQIASDMRHPGGTLESTELDSMQLQGLDRLLWVYLKLLFTEHSLDRFLERTSADAIRQDIGRLEQRLALIDEGDTSAHAGKLRRTLEDNLGTSHDRLDNYAKAEANHEFVQLEISRLENKIKSLAEMAVNRQEPDYISSQVDRAANSMLDTERTMNELEYVTGIGHLDEAAPELMRARLRATES